MTTNHPANGPVSLDRLYQIRETLSKAAAQSDGGNLGYAMADAVKMIDGAITSFDAEPVAIVPVMYKGIELLKKDGLELIRDGMAEATELESICMAKALLSAQSALVFPDEMDLQTCHLDGVTETYAEGWNACRAAMLQAGNSPVTPEGWVMVPKEMTPEMMRAVQIKSELGGYAASELSGAYDMFAEFWDVAVSAATQQEVRCG
ncbi:TPA: hypothetical protein ACGRST_001531 [Escherichia coli]